MWRFLFFLLKADPFQSFHAFSKKLKLKRNNIGINVCNFF